MTTSVSVTGVWDQRPTGYWRHGKYSIVTQYGEEGMEYVVRREWPAGRGEIGVCIGLEQAMRLAYAHEQVKPQGMRPGCGGRPTHYPKVRRLNGELDEQSWGLLQSLRKRLGVSASDAICALLHARVELRKSDLPPKRVRGVAAPKA